MKQFLIMLGILIATGMVVGTIALASETAAVTATVTAKKISVAVTNGTVAYGTVALSGYSSTTASGGGLNVTPPRATNDGSLDEDFNILGSDSANWTLESTIGTNQYTHKFCNVADCENAPTWTEIKADATYTTLSSTTVAAGLYQDFDLQIRVPSASGSYAQQSVNLTVQAVEHT
jgi:hypothetical protein